MAKVKQIYQSLDDRRQKLGLSCQALASRTGLSLRTVQRIFSGEVPDPGFSTIAALAESMGMSISISAGEDAHALRRVQAERKADEIVALVQGTSALEAQAVSADTLHDLRQRTVNELLGGSRRKLWSR